MNDNIHTISQDEHKALNRAYAVCVTTVRPLRRFDFEAGWLAATDYHLAPTTERVNKLATVLEKYIEREPELEDANLTMTPTELARVILAECFPFHDGE